MSQNTTRFIQIRFLLHVHSNIYMANSLKAVCIENTVFNSYNEEITDCFAIPQFLFIEHPIYLVFSIFISSKQNTKQKKKRRKQRFRAIHFVSISFSGRPLELIKLNVFTSASS